MAERIFSGDTAILTSALLQEDEVNFIPIVGADITAVDPNGQNLLVSAFPSAPATGDRVGLKTAISSFNPWDIVEYNGSSWSLLGTNTPPQIEASELFFGLSGLLTETPGLYQVRVKFTTDEGFTKSDRIWFEAIDPIELPNSTPGGTVVDRAWLKLEDLFDSELGGPHLRDRTLANFDKTKMAKLLPDALYNIGATFAPVVVYTEETFPFQQHSPLAGQALLVESIRHLMRSYVEQPLPIGSNITYFDRRDYLNRWQIILQMEMEKLNLWIDLFKQDQLSFGSTAMLVGGYNSPAYRIPRYMRGRYPYQIRY